MYVIIGPTGDIERSVARALRPFDQSLAVSRFKFYLSESSVRAVAEHYGLDRSHLRELARKLPDWMGCRGGVDAIGLFAWQTANPNGKWDWYVIGGRWDGWIHGGRTGHDPYADDRAAENTVSVTELLSSGLKDRVPYGLVTPTGQWFTQWDVEFGSTGFRYRQEPPAAWIRFVRRVLKAFPRHRAVCVDVHS